MPETPQPYDYDLIAKKIQYGLNIKSEQANYEKYPVTYIEDYFGKPWSKQREIIESVRVNKITLVRSSNDVGKTWMMAGIFWWWLDVYRPNCKVITTAKNFTALKFMQWTRIRSHYQLVKDRFNSVDINITDFTPNGKLFPDWFGVGYNPKIEGTKDDPQAEAIAFQGHHSKHTLFIIDEAMTTHPAIFKAMEGSLLDHGSRALIVFNPTSTQGEVVRYEKYDERVNVIKISAFDLFDSLEYKKYPELYTELVNPESAKILVKTFGKDSPIVQSRIFGEYPSQDENAAIKYKDLVKCNERFKDEDFTIGNINKIIMAWDVAELGGDSNVLGVLHCGDKGLKYVRRDKWQDRHNESLKRVYGYIVDEWNYQVDEFNKRQKKDKTEGLEMPVIILIVDAVGEGSHVPSIFEEWFSDMSIIINIISFKGGSGTDGVIEREEVDLLNKNSEAWYRTQLLVEDQINDWLPLACDLDLETISQLTSRIRLWKARHNEPLIWFIESKADYKMRAGGKSPDEADAFIMACFAYSAESSVIMFSM